MTEVTEDMDRRKLSVAVPIPLRDALNQFAKERARRRERRGLPVSPGELKGAGLLLERVAAWLAWIDPGDVDEIERQGEELLARIAEATARGRAEHGPDFEAPLPYSRRSGSVFASLDGEGPVVRGEPKGSAEIVVGRGRKPKGKPGHEDRNRLDRPAAAKPVH